MAIMMKMMKYLILSIVREEYVKEHNEQDVMLVEAILGRQTGEQERHKNFPLLYWQTIWLENQSSTPDQQGLMPTEYFHAVV
jgi:hypothetical protein